MDHAQLRLDYPTAERSPAGEPPVVSVNLLVMWPSVATREEVEETLSAMCANALTAYDRKQKT